MKIKLDELKKAIQWIEENSNAMDVSLYAGEGHKIVLKCMDRMEVEVEIILFADGQMMPKIKKTDILR